MAKFKVKALTVGGLNKKIYKSGDIVDGGSFADADLLVEQGFLIPMEAKKEAPKTEEKPEAKTEPQPEAKPSRRSKRK